MVLPVYCEGDIVALKGKISGEPDFKPVKVVCVLSPPTGGGLRYIVIDERRMLSAVQQEDLKPSSPLGYRKLAKVSPRTDQLEDFVASLVKIV